MSTHVEFSDRWLFAEDELRERWELTEAGAAARTAVPILDDDDARLPRAREVLVTAEQRAGVKPLRPTQAQLEAVEADIKRGLRRVVWCSNCSVEQTIPASASIDAWRCCVCGNPQNRRGEPLDPDSVAANLAPMAQLARRSRAQACSVCGGSRLVDVLTDNLNPCPACRPYGRRDA
jgi:hypothetical protein